MSLFRPFVFVAGLVVTVVVASVPALAADTYNLDPVHSSVIFKIGHNGVGEVYGRFNEFSGSLEVDGATNALTGLTVTAKADSVDTGNERRDQHIKSPDFFNTRQFPEIKVVSKSITKNEDGTFTVNADVTLHGETKPATAKLKLIGVKDTGRQGYRAGFSGEMTIKRSEHGVTFGIDNGSLGDEVTILVGLQGVRQ